MHSQRAAQEDRPAEVIPPVRPSAPWRVRTVTALPEYRLAVEFMDGLAGIVDLRNLVTSPQAGVFAGLRDRALFDQVRIEYGAVTWPGEIDLAPDAMHQAIRASGEWRPG
jgi:hypothetical protein